LVGLVERPTPRRPPADQPDDDDDDLSPRDRYIREISTAWQKPVGGPRAAANSIEALRQRWISPGARPGPGPGYGDARLAVSRGTATKDAVADRDQAYREYVDRISNGWRT
jgi:hypothetical protein